MSLLLRQSRFQFGILQRSGTEADGDPAASSLALRQSGTHRRIPSGLWWTCACIPQALDTTQFTWFALSRLGALRKNVLRNLSQNSGERRCRGVDASREVVVEMKSDASRLDIETIFHAQYERI